MFLMFYIKEKKTCYYFFYLRINVFNIYAGRCIAGVGKSSTSLLAGVKAGRVHLYRVAGNTV